MVSLLARRTRALHIIDANGKLTGSMGIDSSIEGFQILSLAIRNVI